MLCSSRRACDASVDRLDRAARLSEPKHIAEMLTIDAGRNACRRPRGPPSTFARGHLDVAVVHRRRAAATSENVAVLDDRVCSAFSMSLSVPNAEVVVLLLGRAYTQRRWSRLNGRSASLLATMYWRSSGPTDSSR